MAEDEDSLAQAERHVRQFEEAVARQVGIVAEVELDDHPRAAAQAREVLATFEESLRLARKHLRMEQAERDVEL